MDNQGGKGYMFYIYGCLLGSPSVIIANTVVVDTEQQVFNTYFKPPLLRRCCVNDMHAIVEKTEVESLHGFLNTVSQLIKFTKKLEKLK